MNNKIIFLLFLFLNLLLLMIVFQQYEITKLGKIVLSNQSTTINKTEINLFQKVIDILTNHEDRIKNLEKMRNLKI